MKTELLQQCFLFFLPMIQLSSACSWSSGQIMVAFISTCTKNCNIFYCSEIDPRNPFHLGSWYFHGHRPFAKQEFINLNLREVQQVINFGKNIFCKFDARKPFQPSCDNCGTFSRFIGSRLSLKGSNT